LQRTQEAEDSFRQALRSTSYPALAHAVFADFLGVQQRKQEAEEQFLIALALNPDLLLAHRDYAHLLASEWRNHEAMAHFRRPVELDPEDPITRRYFDEFLAAPDPETPGKESRRPVHNSASSTAKGPLYSSPVAPPKYLE
jgi:tetratricopeptide (TPR) repeat protein